jgi:putative hemolysin
LSYLVQLELLTIVLLLAVLLFLSILETVISRLSRLTLRVLAKREAGIAGGLVKRIVRDRGQFLLPLEFGSHLAQVGLAVLITSMLLAEGWPYAPFGAFLILLFTVFIFRHLVPKIVAQSDPEQLLARLLPTLSRCYPLLVWLSVPLAAALRLFRGWSPPEDEDGSQEEEATEEEIEAYIGVGEEEGIFEEEESDLIQSALEFGSTLVKEIMTPRTEIVAAEEQTTISELTALVVSSKHSRIPIYRGNLDQIVGLVYVRNLLTHLKESGEDDPIAPLVNEPLYVPETKKVPGLLKEMQRKAEHMAIVLNEYGTVSGLVTIEDVLEEIVGEIWDEDEVRRVDLVYEGHGNYMVRGGVEVDELEETLGLDLGETDVTTISGFVVAHLGKVPSSGEVFSINGTQVEILSADARKISAMRWSVSHES